MGCYQSHERVAAADSSPVSDGGADAWAADASALPDATAFVDDWPDCTSGRYEDCGVGAYLDVEGTLVIGEVTTTYCMCALRCDTDADCPTAEGRQGRCYRARGDVAGIQSQCFLPCVDDFDCPSYMRCFEPDYRWSTFDFHERLCVPLYEG